MVEQFANSRDPDQMLRSALFASNAFRGIQTTMG